MAKQNTAKPDIAELIRRSDEARTALSQTGAALKQQLNLTSRAKEVVKKEPAKAIGGTLVAGFLLKKLLFRKKKPKAKNSSRTGPITLRKKPRSLPLSALALLGTVAKPAVKIYATKLLKDYLKGRLTPRASDRSRTAPWRDY